MSALEQRLALLARLGHLHGEVLTEIRRETAELVAAGVSWGQVAGALGHPRVVTRDQFFGWAHYRQLRREMARPAVLTVRDGHRERLPGRAQHDPGAA